MPPTQSDHPDHVLVGGGLQNGLIALALLARDPNARLVLIEQGDHLGGNHTWSFHEGTIPEPARPWLAPLVTHRWPRYRVRFPGRERILEHPYATIASDRFHDVVARALTDAPHATLRLGARAIAIGPRAVTLASGEVIAGRLVVDARGPERGDTPRETGYQKFVGLEVELARDVDPTVAELIDALVEQEDGFRFVYVLPFGPRRALIEDTVFADGPELDRDRLRARIHAYCEARGLEIRRVLREEHGVLPMPWRSTGPMRLDPPLVAGFQGGWFHPATGYSVPVALRLALHVAAHAPEDALGEAYRALAREQERQAHFAHLLNELLFTATLPERRRGVFEHFYALPDDVILRFYGLTLSRGDRARLFLRRPPRGVSFAKAMRILPSWASPWGRGGR